VVLTERASERPPVEVSAGVGDGVSLLRRMTPDSHRLDPTLCLSLAGLPLCDSLPIRHYEIDAAVEDLEKGNELIDGPPRVGHVEKAIELRNRRPQPAGQLAAAESVSSMRFLASTVSL